MKKILSILLLISQYAFATNYYVALTGNDLNTGLIGSPWKTIDKINSFPFAANDHVYFNRGDVFYGSISVKRSYLFYEAYGTGAKPVITGLSTVTGWVNISGNLWEAPVTNVKANVNLVLKNGDIQQIGRYPNKDAVNGGYLTYTASTTTSITGPALSTTTNWTSAEVVIRSNRWTIARRRVLSHSGGTVTFTSGSQLIKNNFGYFFQKDSRTLDQDGEWWFDTVNSKLRIYTITNPTTSIYKISTVDTLFKNSNYYTNITVDGILFEGGNVKNLTSYSANNQLIKNCDFINSGGGAIDLRYCANSTIDGCYVNNALGHGIRNYNNDYSSQKNLSVINCTLDSIQMIAGMGIDEHGGEAIEGISNTLTIQNNKITYCGYNGIQWKGSNATIKNNLVNYYCIVKDDGAGIYISGDNTYTPGLWSKRNVTGNIVDHGIGNNNGTDDSNGKSVNGLYVDDGTQNVILDSNTVANIVGGGSHGNDNDSIWFRKNTFFNTYKGVTWQRLKAVTRLVRNLTVTKNIIYPYRMEYRTVALDYPTLITYNQDVERLGEIDSNYYYIRPGIDTSFFGISTYSNLSNYVDHNNNFSYILARGHETNSTVVESGGSLEYNANNAPLVLNFTNSKRDVFGNVYVNTLTLPPWSSKILISFNQPPSVNAGIDSTITLPTNSTVLTSLSNDPDGTLTYLWLKISGPSGSNYITNTNASISLNNLIQGVYVFELTVTDNGGLTLKDTVQVTVNPSTNVSPVVNAGSDQVITLPTNSVTLSGSATDSDGSIVSYSWSKVSGPASFSIVTVNAATTNVINLVQGTYKFELTAIDNSTASGSKQVTVTVLPDLTPVISTSIKLYNVLY